MIQMPCAMQLVQQQKIASVVGLRGVGISVDFDRVRVRRWEEKEGIHLISGNTECEYKMDLRLELADSTGLNKLNFSDTNVFFSPRNFTPKKRLPVLSPCCCLAYRYFPP